MLIDQFEAAQTGNLDWFLEHEKNGTLPDLMEHSSRGWCLLEYAAGNGQLDVLKYLVEECPQKEDVDITVNDNSAVQWAAANGHLDIVKYLLEECPQRDRVDVTADDNYVVRWAAGKLEVLKYLLEDCPQKDRVDVTTDNNYVVQFAAANGHLDVLKYLIEECPQRDRVEVTADDNYAVRWAAKNGHQQVVDYLKPIVEMIEAVGIDNWRTCQTVLSEAEKTGMISFPDGLLTLKELSPELLIQLVLTGDGQQKLKEYLEMYRSQVSNSRVTSKLQL